MDPERRQIFLLGGLTVVIVVMALLSVRFLGGTSPTQNPTSGSSPSTGAAASDIPNTQAATQQAKDVNALSAATSFVWANYIPLSTPPYFRAEFYIYRDGKVTKLASKNGALTNVLTDKGHVFFVVADKRVFQYNPKTGQETSVVDLTTKVTQIAVSPDGTKLALFDSKTTDDLETIEIKVWDKSRRTLTSVATLQPGGIYYNYNHLVWSQKYNALYVSSQGGDGGVGESKIYQVNQSTKQVTAVKNMLIDSESGGDVEYLTNFAADGNSFFTMAAATTSGAWEIKQYDVSTLKGTTLYTAHKATGLVPTQHVVAGPTGSPVLYGNVTDDSTFAAEDLGFFTVNKGIEKLNPGINLNYTDTTASARLHGVNNAFYIYGQLDKTSYRLYLYNQVAKQATLIHSVDNLDTAEGIVSFLGWVKN